MKISVLSQVLYPEGRAQMHHTLSIDIGYLSVHGYENFSYLCSDLIRKFEKLKLELQHQIEDLKGASANERR